MKTIYQILFLAFAAIGPNAFGQAYDYDSAGRLSSVVYPDGRAIGYSYDNRDNLTSTAPLSAPSMPTNPGFEKVSATEAEITWDYAGAEVHQFRIYSRAVGTTDWYRVIIDPLIGPAARSVVVPYSEEEIFEYRVIAVNDFFLESVPSFAVQAGSQTPLFVTTAVDENDHALNRGQGDSLREIIEIARPGDTIIFGQPDESGEFSFPLEEIEIVLLDGELVIDKDLTIDASGQPDGILINGNRLSRIFRTTGGATVTLKGLYLTGGEDDIGGALLNEDANLTLLNCMIIGNNASIEGGGIYNTGTLEIVESRIAINGAAIGGGISNHSGSLNVRFSTFDGNFASAGGGINNPTGTLIIDSSTFSQNAAIDTGGAVFNGGNDTLIENSTFTGNSAENGAGAAIANTPLDGVPTATGNLVSRHNTIVENITAGIFTESPGTLLLDNTIVANNVSQKKIQIDVRGDFTAVGANVVRVHNGTVLSGPDPLIEDPLLEPLAGYGATSESMPPLPGSPVLEAGVLTADTPSVDQHSATRPFGANPEIGSVESRLSVDTDLKWFTTSAGTIRPIFRSPILEYTVIVPATTTSTKVRPAANQFEQTLDVRVNSGSFSEVASKDASEDLPLDLGENLVEVRVTAANNISTKIYRLKVIRGADANSSSQLTSLETSAGPLVPGFDPDIFSYHSVVPNNTTGVNVTAIPGVEEASLSARSNFGTYLPFNSGSPLSALPLRIGDNAIDIKVVALNGTESIYTVTVTREAPAVSSTGLSSFSSSIGPLTPVFNRGVTVYRATTTDETTNATVTAVAAQTGATMQLRANGGSDSALDSGVESAPIPLNAGENIIQVWVRAQDGTTVSPHTLIITRRIDGLDTISRIDTDPVAKTGDAASENVSISGDCRFIAFSSRATNLVTGDTNNAEDVFIFDRTTGIIERVSIADDGTQGNFDSSKPSISFDGQYVAFQSEATNLVLDDTNGDIDKSRGKDIFVYDRDSDTIERVSITDTGAESNQASEAPSISGDGQFVAFVSGASNLITDFANGEFDVYVRNRTADTIVGIAVPFGSLVANLNSLNPAISSDGNYVAFELSIDKSVDSTPGYQYTDIYRYEIGTAQLDRITGTEIGVEADQTRSTAPSISADGRFIAFQSNLESLDFYDTNNAFDVFVYDHVDRSTRRVSANGAEGGEDSEDSTNPSISGNGRFVGFESQVSNLVDSDTNGSVDIFVTDTLTGEITLVSANSDNFQGNADSFLPSISFDGLCIAFQSNATNLNGDDTNEAVDAFLSITEAIAPSSFAGLGMLGSNFGAVRIGENAFSASVPDAVEAALFRAIAAEPSATIEARINSGSFAVIGTAFDSSLPLISGPNTIELKITAPDGSTSETFTIDIQRVNPSNNAELAAFTTDLGELSPAFNANDSLYNLEVPFGNDFVRITVTTADANAVLTIDGGPVTSGIQSDPKSLVEGSNVFIVKAVAEDAISSKNYILSVLRLPDGSIYVHDILPLNDPPSMLRITWRSLPGLYYAVEKSTDLKVWETLQSGILSVDFSMTTDLDFDGSFNEKIFLRVREDEAP